MGRPRSLRIEPGQRFGRLVVLEETRVPRANQPAGARAAVCLCDCGKRITTQLSRLTSGACRSCGCQRRDTLKGQPKTHGMRSHPLYGTWLKMVRRCYNEQDKEYHNYGRRGIRVADRWNPAVVGREMAVSLFISDIEHWLGPRPDGMSLDRICNGHDYRLDNLRWATPVTQVRNSRTTKLTASDVHEIRRLYDSERHLPRYGRIWTQVALAEKFAVSQLTISNILTWKTWSDLT